MRSIHLYNEHTYVASSTASCILSPSAQNRSMILHGTPSSLLKKHQRKKTNFFNYISLIKIYVYKHSKLWFGKKKSRLGDLWSKMKPIGEMQQQQMTSANSSNLMLEKKFLNNNSKSISANKLKQGENQPVHCRDISA